jgi:hypothetical protein
MSMDNAKLKQKNISIAFKRMFLAPGSKSSVAKRNFLKALPQKDNL